MDKKETIELLQNEINKLTNDKKKFVEYCNEHYGAGFEIRDFIDESYDFCDFSTPEEERCGCISGWEFELSFEDIVEFLKWRCSQMLMAHTKSALRATNSIASIYLNNPKLTHQGLYQLYENKTHLEDIIKTSNDCVAMIDKLISIVYDLQATDND